MSSAVRLRIKSAFTNPPSVPSSSDVRSLRSFLSERASSDVRSLRLASASVVVVVVEARFCVHSYLFLDFVCPIYMYKQYEKMPYIFNRNFLLGDEHDE